MALIGSGFKAAVIGCGRYGTRPYNESEKFGD